MSLQHSREKGRVHAGGKGRGRSGTGTAGPYDELFVVGTFDTTSPSSQTQYCSVGRWDGVALKKVGEGLCPRANGPPLYVNAVTLGESGDVFVGGPFSSVVWDGHHFASISGVAQFRGYTHTWLPLGGQGQLGCSYGKMTVASMVWDRDTHVLFIGGQFDRLDNVTVPAGIIMWNESLGFVPFPGGSLSLDAAGNLAQVSKLEYDHKSKTLIVAGNFHLINGSIACHVLAAWHWPTNTWTCLHDAFYSNKEHAIDVVTTIALEDTLDPAAHSSSTLAASISAAAAHDRARGHNHHKSKSRDGDSDDGFGGPKVDDDGGDDDDDHGNGPDETFLYVAGWPNSDSTWRQQAAYGSSYAIALCDVLPLLADLQSAAKHLKLNSVDAVMQNTRLWATQWWAAHSASLSSAGGGRRRRTSSAPRLPTAAGQWWQPTEELLRHQTVPPQRQQSTTEALADFDTRRRRRKPPTVSPGANTSLVSWVPAWHWLPGFMGGNGPILDIAIGEGDFENSIFVAGAFNNYPPVIVWSNDPLFGPEISGIGQYGELNGLVTSVAQLNLKPANAPSSNSDAHSSGNSEDGGDVSGTGRIIFVVVLCAVGGGLLGASVSFSVVMSKEASQADMVGGGGRDRRGRGGGGGILSRGLSLDTLSVGALDLDIWRVFERAMSSRHMTESKNLQIIEPDAIVLHEIIGEGSFGRVWTASWGHSQVAVKEFVFAQAALSTGSIHKEDIVEEIVGEAGIMSVLRHPKILHLYGCTLTTQAIWIVSELCSKGSLRQLLNNIVQELPQAMRLRIALDIAEAMLYLHSRDDPIIHRDLKSHNVFVHETSPGQYVAKIGDWGAARAVRMANERSMTHGVGTACWLAPEVIEHARTSTKSDVYAFGIVLWELATRKEVYTEYTPVQIIAKVAHNGLRPPMPADCAWGSLMRACWDEDPVDRPEFTAIHDRLNRLHTMFSSPGRRKASGRRYLTPGAQTGAVAGTGKKGRSGDSPLTSFGAAAVLDTTSSIMQAHSSSGRGHREGGDSNGLSNHAAMVPSHGRRRGGRRRTRSDGFGEGELSSTGSIQDQQPTLLYFEPSGQAARVTRAAVATTTATAAPGHRPGGRSRGSGQRAGSGRSRNESKSDSKRRGSGAGRSRRTHHGAKLSAVVAGTFNDYGAVATADLSNDDDDDAILMHEEGSSGRGDDGESDHESEQEAKEEEDEGFDESSRLVR